MLQVNMLLKKMGPHQEHEPAKTDLQIVEEVLKEKLAKKNSRSTFLTSLGLSAVSRKSSISSSRIKELEERLEDQEHQSVESAEKYKIEMEQKLKAQQEEFAEATRRQKEQLEALENSHREKSSEFEARQQEMQAMLNYLLRNTQSSQPN